MSPPVQLYRIQLNTKIQNTILNSTIQKNCSIKYNRIIPNIITSIICFCGFITAHRGGKLPRKSYGTV